MMDKLPLKRVLFLFSLLMAVASFGYILSSLFVQAFILRGIQGLAYGVTCTAMSTYIVKTLDPADRLECIGYSALTGNLCNAIYPVIALSILGPDINRFKDLFIVVFISVIVSIVLQFFLKNYKTEQTYAQKENKVNIVLPKSAIVMFFVLFFVSVSMSSVSAFLSLFAISMGFANIGYYFIINVIGLRIARVLAKQIIAGIGEKKTIILMSAAIAGCLLLISFVHSVMKIYIAALPLGFAQGVLAPVINTALLNIFQKKKTGLPMQCSLRLGMSVSYSDRQYLA